MDPFGWRFASAMVGSLMVLVMFRLARRLTGSTLLGLVAGLLMCFDGLQFVLSRLALLDIFQAFFMLCAVAAMVADRDWGRARLAARVQEQTDGGRLPASSRGPRLWWRPWLLLAGLWWGSAWAPSGRRSSRSPRSACSFGSGTPGARRSFGVRWPRGQAALMDAAPALAYLVVLAVRRLRRHLDRLAAARPAYESTLSHTQYGPYWGDYPSTTPRVLPRTRPVAALPGHYHHDVYAFHTKFLNDATHVYQSNPVGWPILNRPVGVDAQLDISRAGRAAPPPAAAPACARCCCWDAGAVVVQRVCPRLVARSAGSAGATGATAWSWSASLVTWLPWLRYDQRPIFSYYAIVIEPFLILGAALLLGEMLGRAARRHPTTDDRRHRCREPSSSPCW